MPDHRASLSTLNTGSQRSSLMTNRLSDMSSLLTELDSPTTRNSKNSSLLSGFSRSKYGRNTLGSKPQVDLKSYKSRESSNQERRPANRHKVQNVKQLESPDHYSTAINDLHEVKSHRISDQSEECKEDAYQERQSAVDESFLSKSIALENSFNVQNTIFNLNFTNEDKEDASNAIDNDNFGSDGDPTGDLNDLNNSPNACVNQSIMDNRQSIEQSNISNESSCENQKSKSPSPKSNTSKYAIEATANSAVSSQVSHAQDSEEVVDTETVPSTTESSPKNIHVDTLSSVNEIHCANHEKNTAQSVDIISSGRLSVPVFNHGNKPPSRISSIELKNADSSGRLSVNNAGQSSRLSVNNVGDQVGMRDSLMNYRPSDLNDVDRTNIKRDSLMAGRLTDMSNVLTQLDNGYRMSVNTKIKADASLPPFLMAAKRGKADEVSEMLSNPAVDHLCVDNHHGQTALHFAVRNGHLAVVQLLQNVAGILNAVDSRGNTALHLAAAKSRRITKVLLEQGAQVDCFNMRSQTALGVHVLTSKRDDPLMTEILLQHKADPNAAVEQSSILHVAIDRSLYEISCRLVRYGARLDLKDESGKMVFDKVNRKVLRRLLAKVTFPPVWVPNEERRNCMLCPRKFSKILLGTRRHHCRHCGRICCGECSHLSVESYKFPKTFSNRIDTGKANKDMKRVCKTCYAVFKERSAKNGHAPKALNKFYNRVVGYQWDEVEGQQNNPVAR